jgi:hypothetical protein
MPVRSQTLAHGAAWTVTVTVSPRFIGYIKVMRMDVTALPCCHLYKGGPT